MRNLKLFLMSMAVTMSVSLSACSSEGGREENRPEPPVPENPGTGTTSTVYMTSEISPEGLMAVYEALGRKATGKVAVKLSTGGPGGYNFLQPSLISDLVREVNGTIVECNTAYGGGRSNTAAHLRAVEDHGKIHLIERIDSRQGMHTLDYAEQIGLGNQQYELVKLD